MLNLNPDNAIANDLDSNADSSTKSNQFSPSSNLHASASKKRLNYRKQNEKITQKMKAKFKNEKLSAFLKPESRAFIAAGMSHAPYLSLNSASVLCSFL